MMRRVSVTSPVAIRLWALMMSCQAAAPKKTRQTKLLTAESTRRVRAEKVLMSTSTAMWPFFCWVVPREKAATTAPKKPISSKVPRTGTHTRRKKMLAQVIRIMPTRNTPPIHSRIRFSKSLMRLSACIMDTFRPSHWR